MLDLNQMTFNEYLEVKENLLENVSQDIEACQQTEIVKVKDGEIELKLNHLLQNLLLLRPFKQFNRDIYLKDIMDTSEMTSKKFNQRLQELLDMFYTPENKLKINDALAYIVEDINYLTLLFNPIRGLSIDVYSIAHLANRNQDFDDIIHTEIDEENYSMSENENYVEKRFEDMLEIIKQDENEMCFSTYIKCGEGLNHKQLKQLAVNLGYKPTISGSVYPKAINTNLLRGLSSGSDYYIDSAGARKAVIINSTEVKDSGYMARRLTLATVNTLLDNSVDDCNTPNYLHIDLTNEDEKRATDTLKRLFLRYAVIDGEEVLITKDNYKEFLGKYIYLRSPITCSCKTGICKKCYGLLSELNDDIHVGKLGVDILSSQLTQMLLSSKHLLDTKSEKIEWNKNLLKILKVNGNILVPAQEFTEAMGLQLLIEHDDLDLEDYVHNNRNDSALFITNLTIKIKNKSVKVHLPKELYPSSDLIAYLKTCMMDEDENYIINMHEFPQDKSLFYFTIENNELSAHLYRLQELIERKDHLGCNTYNELMHEMYNVLSKSKLHINSVHIENLIRELIKDVDTKFRPDFSQLVSDSDYEIFTLDNSILYSKSLVVGLAFEKVSKQLLDVTTYEKDEDSFLDHIFR